MFVDGHHHAQAALDYLGILRPALAPGAVVVLDDVEPGRPVRQAWKRLRATSPQPAFYARQVRRARHARFPHGGSRNGRGA